MNMMTAIARRRRGYVRNLADDPDFYLPVRDRWMMDRSDPDYEFSHPDMIDQRKLESIESWGSDDDEEDDDDTAIDDGACDALVEDGI